MSWSLTRLMARARVRQLHALSRIIREHIAGGGAVEFDEKHARRRMEERKIRAADSRDVLTRGRITDAGNVPGRFVWQGRTVDGEPLRYLITPPDPVFVIRVMHVTKGWRSP